MNFINKLSPNLHCIAVIQILKERRGYDLNDMDSNDWARDLLYSSDFINDMPVSEFALLLEIIAKLPLKHPLYVRLVDEIEGML